MTLSHYRVSSVHTGYIEKNLEDRDFTVYKPEDMEVSEFNTFTVFLYDSNSNYMGS